MKRIVSYGIRPRKRRAHYAYATTTRSEVLKAVIAHPGSGIEGIRALVGRSSTLPALLYLTEHGQLTRRRVKSAKYPNVGSWVYYPVYDGDHIQCLTSLHLSVSMGQS